MAYTVLALETSCDENAGAVVVDGRTIRSSVVASQVAVHARYGGVVPELAGREHLRSLAAVLESTLGEAGCEWGDLDAVAVTQGPGLGGSLLVGVNAAKAIAWARELPCVPVHHIEGHIYANWLEPAVEPYGGEPPPFPLVCLVVSGGHSELLLMEGHGVLTRLGGTLDDAAGEAFDKVARLLGLPFPGGPPIERAAAGATSASGAGAARLPRARLPGTLDFSFSGLKTAVRQRLREEPEAEVGALARAFQVSVVDALVTKTVEAAAAHGARAVLAAGGVAANGALRAAVEERCGSGLGLEVRVPPAGLCTDNAAMVGAAAFSRRGAPEGTMGEAAAGSGALGFDVFSTARTLGGARSLGLPRETSD